MAALCVRSFSLPSLVTTGSFNDFGEDKDEENSTVSTVDSVGLRTPPIVKGKAEPGSPSKSSSLPAYLSTSRLWLSMYEDLASLMDFSATPVDA